MTWSNKGPLEILLHKGIRPCGKNQIKAIFFQFNVILWDSPKASVMALRGGNHGRWQQEAMIQLRVRIMSQEELMWLFMHAIYWEQRDEAPAK